MLEENDSFIAATRRAGSSVSHGVTASRSAEVIGAVCGSARMCGAASPGPAEAHPEPVVSAYRPRAALALVHDRSRESGGRRYDTAGAILRAIAQLQCLPCVPSVAVSEAEQTRLRSVVFATSGGGGEPHGFGASDEITGSRGSPWHVPSFSEVACSRAAPSSCSPAQPRCGISAGSSDPAP